jgi:hypothetical protein
MRNGKVFQRRPLASITNETGNSLLPTARAQYRACSDNRVQSGEHNSNIKDWLAVHRQGEWQELATGWKVNQLWLAWFMGFPMDWDADLETQ